MEMPSCFPVNVTGCVTMHRGSLQDVMIVFMNQDAYDKFRLNKEDYELLKEEEKRIASLKNKEQKEDQKDKKARRNSP